jgi:hypothetical protein
MEAPAERGLEPVDQGAVAVRRGEEVPGTNCIRQGSRRAGTFAF